MKNNKETLVQIFNSAFDEYSNQIALRWREGEKYETMTFLDLKYKVRALAAALLDLGVKKQEHIGLIADCSQLWIIVDLAIQFINAIDIPRGTDTTGEELSYILSHSGVSIVFVHHFGEIEKIKQAAKSSKSNFSHFIVMDDKVTKSSKDVSALSFLFERGDELLKGNSSDIRDELMERMENIKPDDLFTIIYTSGTTGMPKGVMLKNSNIVHAINSLPDILNVTSTNDSALTLLPPWHIFGRMCEYFCLAVGVQVSYTSIVNIGEDMRTLKPTILPAVPRIWEGVYNKIIAKVKQQNKEKIFNIFKFVAVRFISSKKYLRGEHVQYKAENVVVDLFKRLKAILFVIVFFIPKKLGDILVFKKILAATGGNMRYSVSAGGALPSYIDDLFSAMGLQILEGYGLTEAPLVSFRRPGNIVLGTVGFVLDDTEIKLLDSYGNDVTSIPDVKGTLHIKGPQVLSSYYKNKEKTAEVLDADGWFNTGDLVKITTSGMLSIVGRSKDTIVLLGGENVEPVPIEDKLKESEYVDQVMCVGQDEKSIGALVILSEEEVQKYAAEHSINEKSFSDLLKKQEIKDLIKQEISRLISKENHFRGFERISNFRLLDKPFEKGEELSNTFKVKRNVVTDKYIKLIKEMYKK